MIKIDPENLTDIKEAHYKGIEPLILKKVSFYLAAFKVMDARVGYTLASIENIQGLNKKTKTSLLKLLGRRKSTFKKFADWHKISNHNLLRANVYADRTNYINLLTYLENKANLRLLILADVDGLLSEEANISKAWFNDQTISIIKKIICYDEFIDKKTTPYNAFDLVSALKVDVCPYCNRIYTNTIIGTGRKLIIRPTLDHFYHQAEHPLLGLSFYNLIPACTFCNSNLKNQKTFHLQYHIHPYKEGFENHAIFDFIQIAFYPDKSDGRNYKVLINDNSPPLNTVKTRIFGDTAVVDSGNLEVFRLREIYQSHSDIIGELIVKTDKLSPFYAKSIMESLVGLGASKREFYRYYFGNYYEEKDFNKRPLSKLTKDIVSKYFPEILDH